MSWWNPTTWFYEKPKGQGTIFLKPSEAGIIEIGRAHV